MYKFEIKQLDNGRVLRFRLLHDGGPLSWSDVIERWQIDGSFRHFFITLLVDAPYEAYFWETPPVTSTTLTREFEFVLVDSPQLVNVPTDESAFANHFASAQRGASIIEFSNLGGDATLVVPCPAARRSAFSQIRAFSHQAPEDQQHQFWQRVGAALERRLGTQPVWVSTSGLGVYWLHVRLDSTPKYYTYDPYRRPPR